MPVTPMNTLGRNGRNDVKIGQVFGRLQVVAELAERGSSGNRVFVCQCRCGANIKGITASLNAGRTLSCGCLQKEVARERMTDMVTTHGLSRTKEHTSWLSMRVRCEDPSNSRYKWYGARGITVSPEWRRFEAFIFDMGICPPGMTLERVDNSKGYTKENCVWASRATQAQNRRSTKLDWEKVAAIRARGWPLKPLAEEYGVSQYTISSVLLGQTWKLENKSDKHE